MRKEVFYRVVIVALLLLNFGVLAFLWQGGGKHMDGPHGRPPEPAGFIIEKLQLDDAQQAQFEQLKHAHHEHAVQLREESRRLHDALFSLLKNDTVDSSAVDSLQQLISRNDMAKEQLNFHHFKELKTILKPEQHERYKEFIEEIARQFGPPPPRHDRP